MNGIVFIILIVFMGGLIAYLGDKLGTKVGRRKASIFGLRPRYTALIFSISSGVLVAVLTLGLLTLFSRDARTAIFGMEQMKQELSSIKEAFDLNKIALDNENAKYSAVNKQVLETRTKLDEVNKDLNKVSSERNNAIERMKAAKAEYDAAKAELDKADAKLTDLQAAKKELEDNVATLNKSKSALLADVDELTELTDRLKKNMQDMREGLLIFRIGEKLYSAVISDFSSDINNNKEILHKLINEANAYFVDKFDVRDKTEKILSVDEDEVVKTAQYLAANKGSRYLVRLISGGNVIFGEQITAHIEIYPDRLLYREDEVVYKSNVNVGADGSEAEEALTEFLQEVNKKAVEKGVLRDPITGKVGSVPGEEIFTVIKTLQTHRGLVNIEAVATQDIYTAGPLKITLKVQ